MSKERKITYLFDEIGKIDDRFVNEALFIKRKNIRAGHFAKMAIIAAVITFLTVLSVFSVASMSNGDGAPDTDHILTTTTETYSRNEIEDNPPINNATDCDVSLEVLMSSINTEDYETVSITYEDNSLLFDSNVRLIWTYGNSVYYSLTVTDPDSISALHNYLESDKHRERVEDPEESDFRFWISFGDGTTTSPFLENNDGGISVGELADYVPEVYPSDEFAQFIAELVENK